MQRYARGPHPYSLDSAIDASAFSMCTLPIFPVAAFQLRANIMQAVRVERQRQIFDARPVPVFVSSSTNRSGSCIGNIYDGRYNRSRLVRPSCATTSHLLLWPAADEPVWFPVVGQLHGRLCRVPGCTRGPDALEGQWDCEEGWTSPEAAAQLLTLL
jgi:hypothetical protein